MVFCLTDCVSPISFMPTLTLTLTLIPKPSAKSFMTLNFKPKRPIVQYPSAYHAIKSGVINKTETRPKTSLLARCTPALLCLALLAGLGFSGETLARSESGKTRQREGVISRVVDGDTVWLKTPKGRAPLKVRIMGIDAPEICQTGGVAARDALRNRVLGQNVVLNVPRSRSRDDYGRVLATVDFQGQDVGRWMVSNGYAWSYQYRRSGGPYAQEQARATAQRRGIFARSDAENPRSFRKRHGSCPLNQY